MSLVVKNNIPAVYALGTLNRNSTAMSKSLQKVSTGMKINGAADDNSAWAVSERMRVRVRGLDQADQNTQNGRSLLKVAEGAVQSTVDILKTLKEKAINAANDSNTDADRQTIQKELNQAIDQIDDNANVTFNGKYLVDGTKNAIGRATYTALTNQSLSTDTQAGTLLTRLRDRSGVGLNIVSTDKVTVSYVQGGKTYSTTYTVGRTSLQQIFVRAEAIAPGQAFADITNSSVEAATGIPAGGAAAQRAVLQAAIGTANANLTAARTATSNANTALANARQDVVNYQTAQSAADSALNVLDVAVTDPNLQSWCASYASLMQVQSINADYAAWRGTSGFMTGYPNTGSTTGYSTLAAASQGTVSATAPFKAAWDNYGSAYSVFEALHNVADLQTRINNRDTAQQAYNNAVTAENNALDALATAQANFDAMFGPIVATGSNIGLDRAGSTVSTASGENAVTITAASSGIGGQISGLSICITDSEGNVKTAANAALDAFNETIRAEDESGDDALVIHVGAEPGVAIKVGLSDMRAEALGLKGSDGTKLDISTQSKANAAINVLDHAIQKALNQQVDIGSISSHLEYTAANLRVASDNVRASESAIRDADMAKEMTEYTKNNILLSASQSMFSQANQNSMDVMTLLQ